MTGKSVLDRLEMKRREVIRKISREARSQGLSWDLDRQGASHEIYRLEGVMIPISRQRELGYLQAETIWKECEARLGKDWWR